MSRICMLRVLSTTAFVLLASALAPGCDTEEAPVEQRLCERFETCNYFSAGVDVDDCTDIMTMCGESLVRSRRDDWTADAEDALGRNNCGNFLETYQQASACTISPEGTISEGGADPGGGRDDTGAPQPDPAPQTCAEDVFACEGPNQIAGCLDGEAFSLSCDVVCDDLPSDGCRFDDEAESDLCICIIEDEPAPDPPGPAPGE